MCNFIISYWQPCLHQRVTTITTCSVNQATLGAEPIACAGRQDVRPEQPAPAPCPVCQRKRAFTKLAGEHAATSKTARWAEDDTSKLRHSTHLSERGSYSNGSPAVTCEFEGRFAPHPSVTLATSSASSDRLISSIMEQHHVAPESSHAAISICDLGQHNWQDIGNGGRVCTSCNVHRGVSITSWTQSSPTLCGSATDCSDGEDALSAP